MNAALQNNAQKTRHVYYIGVGGKEVFYTFRRAVFDKMGNAHTSHICNLSTDEDEALNKAQTYVNKLLSRHDPETSNLIIEFDDSCEFSTSQEFGKSLPIHVLNGLRTLENGIVPIGKYRGQKLEDLPDDYVLWFADQFEGMGDFVERIVAKKLSSLCLGMALTRSLFEERLAKNAKMTYLGEVGQRIIFEATITDAKVSHGYYGEKFHYILQSGNSVVLYDGTADIGNTGDVVKLKATISSIDVDGKGYKTSTIKRPSNIEIISNA